MESKAFDEIMRGITAELTGDSSADIKYLKDRMEEYKAHPLAKETTRACGCC